MRPVALEGRARTYPKRAIPATPEDNPRHAGLELWMAAYGHQIVSRPASAFDWCEGGRPSHGCARNLTFRYVASIGDAIALLSRPQVSHAAQTDHGYREAARWFRPRV